MSKSIVAIVKGTNEEKTMEKALAHSRGLPYLIKHGATIVQKRMVDICRSQLI